MYLILTFIALPLLALISLVLLAGFVFTRKRKYLATLGAIWFFAIGGYSILVLIAHFNKPIQLKREDTYGTYRIDTNFYPGTNAHWQYNRYRIEITSADSIKLIAYDVYGRFQSKYSYRITYSTSYCGLWNAPDAQHHMLWHNPSLYRTHNGFYYVLKSKRYGNMFFRKEKQ